MIISLSQKLIYIVLSDESDRCRSLFEGADNVYENADVNFNSQRIVLRETGSEGKHHYTNTNILH